MKNKNLITFVAVALALAVFAAIALRQESQTVTNQYAGVMLFPKLKDKVNDVTQIVSQKGEQSVTIKLDQGQWQVVENDGYPANLAKVKQTVLGIANFEIVEAKTKKPENHKKLEVDDSATLVTLKDAQGNAVAAVTLGKVSGSSFSSPSQAKMYVRKREDPQVWLVKGEVHADPMAADWLREELMNIDSKRIRQVSLSQPGETAYRIQKQTPDDAHFVLADMPKGKELKSESAADSLAKVLQNLRLMDVKQGDAVEFAEDKTARAEFQTFDGLVLTADITEHDSKPYVKFAARFDAGVRTEPAEAEKADSATDAEEKEKAENPHAAPSQDKPALKDTAAVQQEAAQLNEKLSPWVFNLAQNKIDLMKKVRADLFKKSEDK